MEVENEKRKTPRHACAAEINAFISAGLDTHEEDQLVLEGATMNISGGGIGMVGDRLLAPGTVVRCLIGVPTAPVPIPTLLKVRWSDSGDVNGRYKLGLQFLI